MKIHHLNCGTMCPFGRRFINGEGSAFAAGEMVCHCLLIEAPNGLVLVDTGFGLDDLRDPRRRVGPARFLLRGRFDPEETALRQVEALGFRAEDVRDIVLTHLDVDHAGGLSDFPQATVHLLAAEKRSAVDEPDAASKARYRPIQWSHGPKWSTYEPDGAPWNGFECVRDLRGLPPEILLVPMTGHTRGHACIAVEADDGWLLHCGDAYFSRQSMVPGGVVPLGLRAFQRVVAIRYRKMMANQARLRELNQSQTNIRLFSAHDPAELAMFR